ncbi:MAG: hypothetical protein AAGF23_09405, partial [Acidobacteriota bacterium]
MIEDERVFDVSAFLTKGRVEDSEAAKIVAVNLRSGAKVKLSAEQFQCMSMISSNEGIPLDQLETEGCQADDV